MENTDLMDRFDYHKMDEDQLRISTDLREMAKASATHLNELVPDCREKSLAITALEEFLMWSNKAIAIKGVFK